MGVYSLAKSSINNWAKYPTMMAGSTELSSDHLITEIVLGSSQTSVNFDVSTLAMQGYKHLHIRVTGRSDRSANGDGFGLRFNGDSGTNYARHYLYGDASSPQSGGNITQSFAGAVNVSASTSTASVFSAGLVDILEFSSVSKYKTARHFNGTPTAGYFVSLGSGVWLNSAPITSVSLFGISGNMVTGSRFSLYASKG